jgi:hypothetical protein
MAITPTALARGIRAHSRLAQRLELAVHVIGLAGVAILFWLVIMSMPNTSDAIASCADKTAWGPLPGAALFVAGVAGPAIGRLAGWFRFHARGGTRAAPFPAFLKVAFTALLVTATVLLVYETLATAGAAPPITSYVRCAFGTQLPITFPTTVAIGFMLSNWLWYPI